MSNASFLRRWAAIAALLAIGFAWSSSLSARSAPAAAGTVKVTIKYTGKGDVDDSHRLWAWLFDSPNIGAGSMPIAETSLDENGGTVTFDGVSAPEVWIAVAYDIGGHFAGMAPPPTGSPVSTYGMETGAPTAVKPGDKSEIAMTFNDSFKMP